MNKVRSNAPMRTAKTGYIILSAVLCIAGIFLITKPDISIAVVGIAAAILMIAFGIIKIIGYLSKDLYRLAFEHDLAFGILLIVLGIIELLNPGTVITVLCTTLGIAALADGLIKVSISMKAKPFGISTWWLILTVAIITIGIGIALLVNPSASSETLMVILGIVLFIEGVLNLITVLLTVKIVANQKPDVIETSYREIN